MKKTETSPEETPIKSNDAIINHLSKEIETMSKNIIDSRNRVSFSLWVGPFLLLGSIIIGSEKGGFGLRAPGIEAWLIVGIAALLFFGVIGYVIGQVEEGAWEKCDQWRECIVRLQMGEEISREEFRTLVLYPQLYRKVSNVYRIVFAISLILFGATIYFISQLLNFTK